MNEQKFHVGIKALIANEKNQVLLLKANPAELRGNASAHWDIPGGRIKNGENPEQTLRKEVKEELGIDDIEVLKLFDASISNLKIPLENETVGLVLFTYLCKLEGAREFTLSSEHTEFKWADTEEAKKLLSVKFSREFIEKLNTM